MNEHNETNEDQDIKRWTAKRRAALVLEILRGQTTVADAAHPRPQSQRYRAVEGYLLDLRRECAAL